MKIALLFNERPEKRVSREPGREDVDEPPPDEAFLEWDSPETIEAIVKALEPLGNVERIPADEKAFLRLQSCPPDFVFNIAEGNFGPDREAIFPALMENLKIPYTGSDPLTLALCLDKIRTKEILWANGLPTPPYVVVERGSKPISFDGLTFPVIVKPAWEGSSKGIKANSLCHGPNAARKVARRILNYYQQPALIEQFLPGREFTVALLGNNDELQVLPIVEIVFDELPKGAPPIYGYEAKWVWDCPQRPLRIFRCPAQLSVRKRRLIENLCKKAFQVFGCRDWCRIDLRCDAKGRPHILELNPLPGILPNPEENSCFPKAARAAGMSYEQVVQRVVEIACKRLNIKLMEYVSG